MSQQPSSLRRLDHFMSTGHPKSSEVSAPRTAYAFLRPMPGAASGEETGAELPRSVIPRDRDRWDRLFPSTAGVGDPGSSYQVNGLQFGPYIIQERIGRGGMGAVFRAIDSRLDRVVALKVLAPEYTRDPASVQRFQNEARAAAKLDHETIARVFASGEDSGQHYIAFEFISGTNLREMVQQRGTLSVPETVSTLLQMAEALRHTSALGVVHRDVKPSNIIVTASGRAKLVDLGLARQAQLHGEDLTVHGTTLGTFDYISPEQSIDPRNVDVRSDIYSLGCTAYHMLTGEPPYPRGTMIQKVMDHHALATPDPRLKNPLVPLALSQIVQKMMASQIDARYQRPEDLIRDLTPLAHALGIATRSTEGVAVLPPTFTWSEFRGWILSAGILLAVGVLASWPPTEAEPLASPVLPAMNLSPDPKAADRSPKGAAPAAEASGTKLVAKAPAIPRPETSLPTPQVGGFKAGTNWGPGLALIPTAGTGSIAAAGNATARPPSQVTPMAIDPAPGVTLKDDNRFWIAASALGDTTGAKAKSYPTLEAACLDAPDHATIELRYDGEAPPQRPIRIEGKSLRIRAETGRRPVLRFEAPGALGLPVTSQMISIVNGGLDLFDIDLVFRVPRGRSADRWSIFSLQYAKKVVLHGVSVTVENSLQQQPATLFEVRSVSASAMDRLMPDGMMKGPIHVEVSESIFRGEADGFYMAEAVELQVEMTHAAWALDGVLIAIDTGDRIQMATMSEPTPVRLQLNHVTVVVENGLARFEAGEAQVVPALRIESHNSLITIPREDRSLVTMSGPLEMRDWQARLQWVGSHNYLEVTGSWWDISGRSISASNRRYNAADWNLHWNSMGGTLVDRNVYEAIDAWQKPTYHSVNASAFRLYSQSGGQYKAPEGDDGRHAGVDWSLPRVPVRFPDL